MMMRPNKAETAANELGEMIVRMRDVMATPGFGVTVCSLFGRFSAVCHKRNTKSFLPFILKLVKVNLIL